VCLLSGQSDRPEGRGLWLPAPCRRFAGFAQIRAIFRNQKGHWPDASNHPAITSGLGVGVLVEGSMVPGERAYLEKEGFPVLKEVKVHLDRTYANRSRTVQRLIDHYVDFFTAKTA
jgi:hypothetical protein